MCQHFEAEQRAMWASEDAQRKRACREAGGHVYHGGSSVCSRCFERRKAKPISDDSDVACEKANR